MRAKNWFAKAWAQNTIISGLLALVIWGTIVYLSIIGTDPPDVLVGAGGVIIGFFFRSKLEASS